MRVTVPYRDLIFRSIRTGIRKGYFNYGEELDVLTTETVARQRIELAKQYRENFWIEVRRANGDEGICSAQYVDIEFSPSYPIKPYVGLHGPADPAYWPWEQGGFDTVSKANVPAVKLLTPGHSSAVVKHLPNVQFFMARLFSKFETPKTPSQFVSEVEEGVRDLVLAGVTHFEVHNEPNLHIPGSNPEGWDVAWHSGKEFADWFIQVYYFLKLAFPGIKLGFPGLSPGSDYYYNGKLARRDSNSFANEASEAISRADWLGMHTYWNAQMSPQNALNDIYSIAAKYPDKEIYVTEISNADYSVDPATKAQQYRWLIDQDFPSNVKAYFFYLLSASVDLRKESWKGTVIPEIIGSR